MIADVVFFMRIVVLVICSINCAANVTGLRDLAMGKNWPPAIYQSVVFFLSFGSGWFQVNALSGLTTSTPNAYTLAAHVIIAVGGTLAIFGHRVGQNFQKLHPLFPFMGVATAIADLARVDPEKAEQLAKQCRQATAEWMLRNE